MIGKRGDDVRLSKLDVSPDTVSASPTVLSCSILLSVMGITSMFVRGRQVNLDRCKAMAAIPVRVTSDNYEPLLTFVDGLFLCPGNFDGHFVRMCADKKGTLRSTTGGNIGFVDTFSPFNVKDVLRTVTIRSVACQMLVLKLDTRCSECAVFRCTLRRKYSRWLSAKDNPSKFANNFTLTTPQRHRKLQQLSKAKKRSDTKISKLAAAVHLLVKKNSVPVKSSMHGDVLKVVEETDRFVSEAFPEGSLGDCFGKNRKRLLLARVPMACAGIHL